MPAARRSPQNNNSKSTDAGSSPAAPARTRRASGEVRRLILNAAQELFAANGFRGTSTREIADSAGVAEVLLFRNFGSKAELYSAAVVGPITEFIDEWIASGDWSKWDERTTQEKQREFIARLYSIVEENRGLIMSYLAMTVFEPEFVTGLEHTPALLDALDRLADAAGDHLLRLRPRAKVRPRLSTRAIVAMIVAMALFHDLWDLSTGFTPPRDDVVDEMTMLVLHGALHRDGATPLKPRAAADRAKRRVASNRTRSSSAKSVRRR